eukprot:Phypoly_transcript_12790.p1 GENE.Phypoly_transcript_12790~~Phypoly_transcript_12790.p1  ORF type:complete len:355 (+),score=43.64 Phypoly_transcript_12790:141-1067(+)
MALLPFFKYSAFAVATPNADFNSAEGVGILSRHPIIDVDHYNFTIVPSDGDKNTRTCLSATILVPKIGKLQVYVTHLSYERTTQCRQIAELLSYIEKDKNEDGDCSKKIPKVLAGDFNIYADYEAPSDILTKPISEQNPCFRYLGSAFQKQNDEEKNGRFADVWRDLHPHDPGLTFSLMPFKDAEHFVPSTGLESRPDRIYLKTDSCVLRATAIQKTDGTTYKSLFLNQILHEQLNVHLTNTGWPYVIYIPPLLFIFFALFRVPRVVLFLALVGAIYTFYHVQDFPSNPDDFFPSDHLALIATFTLNS